MLCVCVVLLSLWWQFILLHQASSNICCLFNLLSIIVCVRKALDGNGFAIKYEMPTSFSSHGSHCRARSLSLAPSLWVLKESGSIMWYVALAHLKDANDFLCGSNCFYVSMFDRLVAEPLVTHSLCLLCCFLNVKSIFMSIDVSLCLHLHLILPSLAVCVCADVCVIFLYALVFCISLCLAKLLNRHQNQLHDYAVR